MKPIIKTRPSPEPKTKIWSSYPSKAENTAAAPATGRRAVPLSVPAPPRPTVAGGRIRRPRREAALRCLRRLPASFKRHGIAIGVQAFATPTRFGCLRAADAARRMGPRPAAPGTPAPLTLRHGDELVRPPTLLH
ncbi:hypothetical protein PVAP13_1NG086300 [Panicum virgatum]|uniref:Uncharacterized protein n=1 Tax=Panicum virgatum TaxID=38727 RepID=A0A8T0WTS3_PANVG|nr:hypothetical protein PVAP13_1NG086300 [Panicum virgatum]